MCSDLVKKYAEVADEMAMSETACIIDGDIVKARVYAETRSALIGQIKDKLTKAGDTK